MPPPRRPFSPFLFRLFLPRGSLSPLDRPSPSHPGVLSADHWHCRPAGHTNPLHKYESAGYNRRPACEGVHRCARDPLHEISLVHRQINLPDVYGRGGEKTRSVRIRERKRMRSLHTFRCVRASTALFECLSTILGSALFFCTFNLTQPIHNDSRLVIFSV